MRMLAVFLFMIVLASRTALGQPTKSCLPWGPANNAEASALVSSEPGPSGTYRVRLADLEHSKDRAEYEQFFRESIGMTDTGLQDLLSILDDGGCLQINLENNLNISNKAVFEIDIAIVYYIKNCQHTRIEYPIVKTISSHLVIVQVVTKPNKGSPSRPDVTIEECTEDSPVDDSVQPCSTTARILVGSLQGQAGSVPSGKDTTYTHMRDCRP